MTDQHPNGRHDTGTDAEAARLGAAWDDLAAGHPVEVDGHAGLIELARSLSATVTTVRGRPGFREDLRDTIMSSAASALPTRGAMPAPFHQHPAPRRLVVPTAASVGRLGVRWLGVAATVALLLATVAGGYLSGVGRPGGNAPATHLAAPFDASPEAGDTPATVGCGPAGEVDPYLPCGGQRPNIVGTGYLQAGLVDAPNFPTEDFEVSQVQMQRWQIEGDEAVTFTAPVTPLPGIGLDIVINGAYTATFSGPVRVGDDQSRIRGLMRYVSANTAVELVSGDSVSYELGTKLEIRNPLASSLLQFKTILFHDGDPSPSNLGASGDVQMMVDGNGTLPQPLSAYSPSGAGIVITYSQIIEGYPFPPKSGTFALVLGPVDPVNGPAGTEGFILWVYQGVA